MDRAAAGVRQNSPGRCGASRPAGHDLNPPRAILRMAFTVPSPRGTLACCPLVRMRVTPAPSGCPWPARQSGVTSTARWKTVSCSPASSTSARTALVHRAVRAEHAKGQCRPLPRPAWTGRRHAWSRTPHPYNEPPSRGRTMAITDTPHFFATNTSRCWGQPAQEEGGAELHPGRACLFASTASPAEPQQIPG